MIAERSCDGLPVSPLILLFFCLIESSKTWSCGLGLVIKQLAEIQRDPGKWGYQAVIVHFHFISAALVYAVFFCVKELYLNNNINPFWQPLKFGYLVLIGSAFVLLYYPIIIYIYIYHVSLC